ncbi:hypothetical protein Bbelb_293000 [Branchiostoma belcheri]|nr:hypothetical protein Bbelb_293000 [Branchiostoma belcheri]
MTVVEEVERRVSRHLRKWLGVPPGLTSIGLYSKTAKLQLPLTSMEKEYKVTKARAQLMLQESRDELVSQVGIRLRSGKKWAAAEAVASATSRLKHRDIVGVVAQGRRGFGAGREGTQRWGTASPRERRELIQKEVRQQEEEVRRSRAVSQGVQGAWTRWEGVRERKVMWNELMYSEPLKIRFLLKSVYDLLPTAANLKRWRKKDEDKCELCGKTGNLSHVLTSCPVALGKGRYTWRHNQVLKVIASAVEEQITENKLKGKQRKGLQFISFENDPGSAARIDCSLGGQDGRSERAETNEVSGTGLPPNNHSPGSEWPSLSPRWLETYCNKGRNVKESQFAADDGEWRAESDPLYDVMVPTHALGVLAQCAAPGMSNSEDSRTNLEKKKGSVTVGHALPTDPADDGSRHFSQFETTQLLVTTTRSEGQIGLDQRFNPSPLATYLYNRKRWGAPAVPGTSSASASEVLAQGAETPQELKRQLDELKQEVQAMREKKVSTESLLNELNIYCATHHDATFAPNHAMALERGHERAEEFEAFAEELVTEKSKPFFGPLVRRLFGSSVKAQAASKVSAFIKSWKAVKDRLRCVRNPTIKSSINIPAWEKQVPFNPLKALEERVSAVRWVRSVRTPASSARAGNRHEFISRILEDRIRTGALEVLGRVGEVDPPYLTMPLVVEPKKPRVPVSQYIDDRHAGLHLAAKQGKAAPPLAVNPEHAAPSLPDSQKHVSPETQDAVEFQKAESGAYILCKVLIDLGYFLELKKSVLILSKVVKFLGMLVWSVPLGFGIPGDKIQKFGTLRAYIAEQGEVDVRTLQRFVGKCVAFSLVIPMAKLFTREACRAIGRAIVSGSPVVITKELREEIIHWRVIDDHDKIFPSIEEKHMTLQATTDASSYACSGVIKPPGSQAITVRDYWTAEDFQAPIHVEEAKAIALTLKATGSIIENARVMMETDNQAVEKAWEGEGGEDLVLVRILKGIFETARQQNAKMLMIYVPSKDNCADSPSRRLSPLDATLSTTAWATVERAFGPHTIDWMAVGLNTKIVRFISPTPSPNAEGVDFFNQKPEERDNGYIFPPFATIGAVLQHLGNRKAPGPYTLIVPELHPKPYWWAVVNA